ncbi:hypothetical protein E2C01_049993 [Portunus trituberculatus]|uniref:Uncharacterized protein n=1 Tax=Portunus trituberculatus TaxID=210409 RepID=A0A5B7GHL1_PORTR|nr:hypothetical protein [Portunus trituberculatus]
MSPARTLLIYRLEETHMHQHLWMPDGPPPDVVGWCHYEAPLHHHSHGPSLTWCSPPTPQRPASLTLKPLVSFTSHATPHRTQLGYTARRIGVPDPHARTPALFFADNTRLLQVLNWYL